MPRSTNDEIVSETTWITLRAAPEPDFKSELGRRRNWHLTIHVSGIELEFVAVEGGTWHSFSKDEAWQRVKEFEHIMSSENLTYMHAQFSKFLKFLSKQD